MRRILLIAAVLCMGVAAGAQDNSHRIGLGAGVSYHFAGDAVLFWEFETHYHNAWEVFAEGQMSLPQNGQQFGDVARRWGLGAVYKPCIYRTRNRYGSARFGVSFGASPSDFQAALLAGWQQSYVLRGGWQFYWQAGAGVTLPKWNGLFHAGAGIGIKMPVRIR